MKCGRHHHHHHHHHHGHARPIWRIRHRLHRRIFMWFGVSIALASATSAIAWAHGERSWTWAVVALAVLWAGSGAIARRLTRPLAWLMEASQDIGSGDLSRRSGLRRIRHGELRVIADAVDDMALRIERQLRDQRELLAAVSHELRTPLGHLRVLVGLLKEGRAGPRLAADIEQEIVAIDGLVGQLLASSRVDFGQLKRRPVDGVAIALQALERSGIDPDVLDASHEVAPVQADPSLLLQALANLLRNAEEHGGGTTTLKVVFDPERLRFDVEDDGPGITGDPEAVFVPFRGGPRARAGSLGLGLALVRRIARAHGGDAVLANRAEGGARATLWVPRRPIEHSGDFVDPGAIDSG